MNSFQSQVIIKNKFPQFNEEGCVLLYDQAIFDGSDFDVEIQKFVDQFENRWGVKGGESLKAFRDFPKNLELLLKKWPQPVSRNHTLVVLGGGSLGDFGGFAASVIKRGVGLIHIPSTWLSAMDSAHGGKTALNLNGIKNQVGSFYPAKKVYVIRDLLESTPKELKEQSYGELIKMGLIGQSQFFKEIQFEKRDAQDFLWRFLKFCIEDKYEVILQDPYETEKIRQVLNFGHTLGHALESHFLWPHGDSVLQGVFFALEWSRYRGELSQNTFDTIMKVISEKFERVPATLLKWYKKPSRKVIKNIIIDDKKMKADGTLNFVFLKSIGKPIVKTVLVEDLLSEASRQNWIK